MRAFFSIFHMRVKRQLQYRAAAVAGVVTNFIFGFMMVMVLAAFVDRNAAPLSVAQGVAYVWLGQIHFRVMPFGGDGEIMAMMRTGDVSFELLRPMDLYGHWFSRALALRLTAFVMNALLMFPLCLLIPGELGMMLPTWPQVAAYLLACVGAVLMSAAITNLFSISLFWTVSGEGIVRIVPTLVSFLAGTYIPLALLPDWMQTFLAWQPFGAMVDWPARLFTGMWGADMLPRVLALQLGWTLVFMLAGRLLMGVGLKKLRIQGG